MIFKVNFKQLWKQLTPPKLRKTSQNDWGEAQMTPMDYNNLLFNEYRTGSTYSLYDSGYTYSATNRVLYSDNSIYENLTGSTNVLPTDIYTWIKVNDSYIGAIERSKYNAQKYLFEYALNRYFQVSGTTRQSSYGVSFNNIFIENNLANSSSFLLGQIGQTSGNLNRSFTYSTSFLTNAYTIPDEDYTVWVPNYIFTATTVEKIDAIVSTLNIAGMSYSIKNY